MNAPEATVPPDHSSVALNEPVMFGLQATAGEPSEAYAPALRARSAGHSRKVRSSALLRGLNLENPDEDPGFTGTVLDEITPRPHDGAASLQIVAPLIRPRDH